MVAAKVPVMGDSSSDGRSNEHHRWQLRPPWQQWSQGQATAAVMAAAMGDIDGSHVLGGSNGRSKGRQQQ